MPYLKNSQKGFSLVEVMLAGAIGIALVLGIVTFVINQQNEIKSLYQKSEALEFKGILSEVLGVSGVCTWQLIDQVVDLTGVTTDNPSSTEISLPALYRGPNFTSAVLAKQNEKLLTSTSGVKVESILFKNIVATGNPSEYVGRFEIHLDRSTLVRPLKPITQLRTFKVKTVAGVTKIDRCSSSIDIQLIDVTDASCSSKPNDCDALAKCPPDYKLVGCWNGESAGSLWQVLRDVPPDGHDECHCIGSSGGKCWFATATCMKL